MVVVVSNIIVAVEMMMSYFVNCWMIDGVVVRSGSRIRVGIGMMMVGFAGDG